MIFMMCVSIDNSYSVLYELLLLFISLLLFVISTGNKISNTPTGTKEGAHTASRRSLLRGEGPYYGDAGPKNAC